MKLVSIRSTRLRARIGRAVIAAFAAQVVAGAMCLMPATVMAAVPSQTAGVMAMHDDACTMHQGMPQSHTRHACPHCDQPASMVPPHISIDHPPALSAMLMAAPQWPVAAAIAPVIAQPAPTGPPRSASLLLTQTQRLRI